LIHPFFEGKTPAEFLAFLIDDGGADARSIVEATFAKRMGARGDWRRAVHDGFARNSGWPELVPDFGRSTWSPRERDFAWNPVSGSKTEVVFLPDYTVHDGRFANNGWLQEAPDPMTKLTWDNAALVNPLKARELGLSQGDLVEIRKKDRSVVLPVYLMPGQALGSIAVSLGYGRGEAAGKVADGCGFDAYRLRTTDWMHFGKAADITSAGGSYELVSTQEHHAIKNTEQGQGQEHRLPELFREEELSE
jgi:molybdopterin-containing oxidoreductase family iron-sulfur binding subunit